MPAIKERVQVEQPTPRKSGRVAFNENGNAVWEWQTATGVFERFISDEKLEQLSAPDLAIAEEPTVARKYEGLWVHDEHRKAKPVVPQSPSSTPKRSGALRGLLRKLSFSY